MARVGTRLNPGSGGLGISLFGGKDQKFELKKQREAQIPSIWEKLASQGIDDPEILNSVGANYVETGLITLPKTRVVPAEGPSLPGALPPQAEVPLRIGKPAKTSGIALVSKSGGRPEFMASPYDDIKTVDYGVTPTKPAAADVKDDLELKRVTTMVKAALKTGEINIGGQPVDVKTKDDITNVLMSAGIDPASDPNLAAAIDQFPESEPPNKFMQWWSGAAKAGKDLISPSKNGNQQKGITATNPQTGQKVISYDGGKTWQKIK